MKKVTRKIAFWLSVMLAVATIPAFTSAASALPEAVEIRLITPVLDDTNSWRDVDMEANWVGQNWFADGFTFRQGWAPAGSTIHFTYLVTDPANGDEPLPYTNVKLRVNKGYSMANSIVTVNGQGPTDGVDKAPLDQLQVNALTDAFGFVTFTMVSLDTQDMCGEPKPELFTDRGEPSNFDCNISLYTQIYPEVTGQLSDIADMTEIHFYKEPSEPEYEMGTTTARIVSPVLEEETAVERTDVETEFVSNYGYPEGFQFFQKYAPASRRINLIYHVEDQNGQAIAGTEVQLGVGKGWSNSNAKVTDGTHATSGVAGQADQATWSGTTDAFGNVLYKVKSNDLTGQTKPETWTTPFLGFDTGAVFTQMYPDVIGGGQQLSDMIEFHFYTDPTAAKTAITVTGIKGKIKVVVANPHGKAVKITIDGKKVTKNPAEDKTSVTYLFKKAKGKHKVIVICNSVKKTSTVKVK